jgi:hypothetical protein
MRRLGFLEHHLAEAGFELPRVGAFPDFEPEPDEATWSAFAVARSE